MIFGLFILDVQNLARRMGRAKRNPSLNIIDKIYKNNMLSKQLLSYCPFSSFGM